VAEWRILRQAQDEDLFFKFKYILLIPETFAPNRNSSLRGAKRCGNPGWRRGWIASPEARNDDLALRAEVSRMSLSKDAPGNSLAAESVGAD
jgi:hypothetical protein